VSIFNDVPVPAFDVEFARCFRTNVPLVVPPVPRVSGSYLSTHFITYEDVAPNPRKRDELSLVNGRRIIYLFLEMVPCEMVNYLEKKR
jgi:hypothetical protein